MVWFRWLFLGLGVLILILCIYLIVLNRGSESIQSKSFTVVFVGALGLLISILFGLKAENIDKKVQFSFFFERFPFELIDMSKYATSDEKPSEDFNQHRIENSYNTASFNEITESLEATSQEIEFLNDLLVRKFFDILYSKFRRGWNIEETGFLYPHGYAEFTEKKKPSNKTDLFISLSEIKKLDSKNKLLGLFITEQDWPEKKELGFYLPPKTIVKIEEENMNIKRIILDNPFVKFEMLINSIYYGFGTGELLIPELEGREKIYSMAGIIKLKAEFNSIRVGHPEMPDYKSWVELIFDRFSKEVSSEKIYENFR